MRIFDRRRPANARIALAGIRIWAFLLPALWYALPSPSSAQVSPGDVTAHSRMAGSATAWPTPARPGRRPSSLPSTVTRPRPRTPWPSSRATPRRRWPPRAGSRACEVRDRGRPPPDAAAKRAKANEAYRWLIARMRAAAAEEALPSGARPGFKLVSIAMPATGMFAHELSAGEGYFGSGTEAGYKCEFLAGGDNHPCSYTIRWSLPAALVPGETARFSISGAQTGDTGFIMRLRMGVPSGGMGLMLGGVRERRGDPGLPRLRARRVLRQLHRHPPGDLPGGLRLQGREGKHRLQDPGPQPGRP